MDVVVAEAVVDAMEVLALCVEAAAAKALSLLPADVGFCVVAAAGVTVAVGVAVGCAVAVATGEAAGLASGVVSGAGVGAADCFAPQDEN